MTDPSHAFQRYAPPALRLLVFTILAALLLAPTPAARGQTPPADPPLAALNVAPAFAGQAGPATAADGQVSLLVMLAGAPAA
ncbi:MAG: hypothetical protein ACRC1H_14505, partial [Caldilineaceae bacterium]